MVLGVVVGLLVGLAAGLLWHFVRHADVHAAARTAQARLADARAASSELTSQLETAVHAAAAAETARAVCAAELDYLKKADEQERARAGEERRRLAGTFAELSAQALQKNNEQFLAWPRRNSARPRRRPRGTSPNGSRPLRSS